MKQKVHRGAKKRFKVTGGGKVVGRKASARHLMRNKSKGQKKMQTQPYGIEKGDSKNVKKMLKV